MSADRCPSSRTWQVPAAAPRDPRHVDAGPGADATPYRAWHDWPRPALPRPGHHHPPARGLETTGVEVPRTWAAPAARSPVGEHHPVARRLGPPGTGTVAAPVPPRPERAPRPHPREHGERGRFLALARQRLTGGTEPFALAPPPSSRPAGPDRPPAPRPAYPGVDPRDLLASFARAVEEAGGVCHRVVGRVPDLLLDHLVAELDAWDVVVAADPEARAVGERLADRGVEVVPAGRDTAGGAVLGVTSAVAGIAATGAVVVDSGRSGGPLAAAVPPVHLCVLPVERLVATPADVLRPLGTVGTLGPGPAADPGTEAVPASLSLVIGPGRRGDIEQLLTAGVPGPGLLHVVVVSPPPVGPGSP